VVAHRDALIQRGQHRRLHPHHCKIAGRSDTLFSDDAIALIHNPPW